MNPNILFAIVASILFGISTPLAKLLVGETSPLLLGGLLYLGSGIGLGLVRVIRDRGWQPSGIPRKEWPWLTGAVFFGGILAPVALMYGLAHTSGSTASLLLNLEAVLTALIAWVVFRENADRRVILGMAAIVLGGLILSWPAGDPGREDAGGPLAVSLACACWAIDNNLTRRVSASDALFIAGSKGLIAGAVNCTLALTLGANLPRPSTVASIMTVGLLGYGVSLLLFVLALRGLGTARTGAYFSTAPMIGALFALVFLDESATIVFWIACALMGVGLWLHLSEQHEHVHNHEPLEHDHSHPDDAHHRHEHGSGWNRPGFHRHRHHHSAVTHKHPHFPDIHHQHEH